MTRIAKLPIAAAVAAIIISLVSCAQNTANKNHKEDATRVSGISLPDPTITLPESPYEPTDLTVKDTVPRVPKDSISVISLSEPMKHELLFAPGIWWTEDRKQDSVLKIFIEGDTLTAIRNLLIYCLQEGRGNVYAGSLLDMINLGFLEKVLKDERFSFNLKEYTKVKAANEKDRQKAFPEYYAYKKRLNTGN